MFQFKHLSKQRAIKHFVTERKGGVSSPPFDSLNMSLNVGDDKSHVIKNRQIVAKKTGIPFEKMTFTEQVHGNSIALVDGQNAGKGLFSYQDAINDADGLITNKKQIPIIVLGADCVPVLFYDPVNLGVGAVHSGWRSTVKNIAQKAISEMNHHFHSKPENILAGIAPSIGACCYEVDENVVCEVEKAFGTTEPYILPSKREKKYIFDLWNTIIIQLKNAGIKEQNIENSAICTHCNHHTFFSARRAGRDKTGRFAAGIMLR